MCCGSAPAAPESKDLLAIIHPTQHDSEQSRLSSHSRPYISGRLRLSNATEGCTSTYFQHSHSINSTYLPLPSAILQIRIHHFGSPLHETASDTSDYFSENPVLHSFSIPNPALGSARDIVSLAQSRFDLGVGGQGIIGRTISVTDGHGGLLGQGIIGRM